MAKQSVAEKLKDSRNTLARSLGINALSDELKNIRNVNDAPSIAKPDDIEPEALKTSPVINEPKPTIEAGEDKPNREVEKTVQNGAKHEIGTFFEKFKQNTPGYITTNMNAEIHKDLKLIAALAGCSMFDLISNILITWKKDYELEIKKAKKNDGF